MSFGKDLMTPKVSFPRKRESKFDSIVESMPTSKSGGLDSRFRGNDNWQHQCLSTRTTFTNLPGYYFV